MKCAIISGSSRGIGKVIAQNLAKSGYHVIINYNNSAQHAKELYDTLTAEGLVASIFKADVSKSDEVDKMFEFASKVCGTIDLVVCNAGISKSGLLIDMSADDIASLVAVNLVGVINCCQNASKYMLPQHFGKIVNISSMWGEVGGACESVYSATKGGVIAFTKALAKELGYNGITVNCITPGLVDTEMNSNLTADDINAVIEQTPCGRIGTAQDIADAVLFVASDKANFVNGQIIGVNGGLII